MNLINLLNRDKFDRDVYNALLWKKPDSIQVQIKQSGDTYFAKLVNFENDNVITQASTGEELIIMVNEAMYDYLAIPDVYRSQLGYFLPPEDTRKAIKSGIPSKYLNTTLSLQKA